MTSTMSASPTPITHLITASPASGDETPLDNEIAFNDSVVGSYDPNDKLLDPKVLSPAEVAQGETPIEYTIRFQNTGTYLAERVVILDTLSEDLQWESMRFIASSHDHHWYITDGVLHVIHNDIMLPDSNANEAESHGFFKFSMLPMTDLQDGAAYDGGVDFGLEFHGRAGLGRESLADAGDLGVVQGDRRLAPGGGEPDESSDVAADQLLPHRVVQGRA